jgi:hypothetical protein
MKNTHILSILITVSTTIHAMEQNNQVALPDWRGTHQKLCTDYRDILKTKLAAYKKADITTTAWDMDTLITAGTIITKFDHSNIKYNIFLTTKDEHNNSFFHSAVEKNDVATVKWLSPRILNNQYLDTNNDGQTPLDLCIKKLLPNDIYKRASEMAIARQIFYSMLSDIGKLKIAPEIKEKCLTTIINLQLQWKGYGLPFNVDPDLLTKLLTAERLEEEPSLMNRFYRKASYYDGRTFTHIPVYYLHPDELFELVKKDQISFAKDNKGQSALDLALQQSKQYTQPYYMTKFPGTDQKASCCVYILLNHAKALALKGAQNAPDISEFGDFGPCCEKHTVSKAI